MFAWLKKALSSNGNPSSMRLFNAWTMGLGVPTICFSIIWLTIFYGWNTTTIIGALGVLAGLIGTVLKFKRDQKKDEKSEN